MKSSLIVIFIFTSLSLFASTSVKPKVDLAQKMLGIWAETYTNDGDIIFYTSYLPNNRFVGFGLLDENAPNSHVVSHGVWKMVGNQSCIIQLHNSLGIEDTTQSCVTIISVNDSQLVFMANDDNSLTTMKRVSNGLINQHKKAAR